MNFFRQSGQRLGRRSWVLVLVLCAFAFASATFGVASEAEVRRLSSEVRNLGPYFFQQCGSFHPADFKTHQTATFDTTLLNVSSLKRELLAARNTNQISAYQMLQIAKDLNEVLRAEYGVTLLLNFSGHGLIPAPTHLFTPEMVAGLVFSNDEMLAFESQARATLDDQFPSAPGDAFIFGDWKQREVRELDQQLRELQALLFAAESFGNPNPDKVTARRVATEESPKIIAAFQKVRDRLVSSSRFGFLTIKGSGPDDLIDSAYLIRTFNGLVLGAALRSNVRYYRWIGTGEVRLFTREQKVKMLSLVVGQRECLRLVQPTLAAAALN